jgi:dihydroorotate dehydrogenase
MSRDAFYEDWLRPLLFAIEPEEAHELAHRLMRMFSWALDKLPYRYGGTDLKVTIGRTIFSNPVGLAAGFDKNAALLDIVGLLGFGFVEVGSITGRSSEGNPQPRLFRLPADKALINRLGLNGEGADVVSARLKNCRPSTAFGINIAKTNDPSLVGDAAVEDILHSFKAVKDTAGAAYVALNASCPNTKEGCLRERKDLDTILGEMQRLNSNGLPLFVKISPDSTGQLLQDIVELASKHRLSGFVCGNTTTTRSQLQTPESEIKTMGQGGLSGAPLRPLALELCRKVARIKTKSQQIIAVGGISSGAQAYEFIRSGASALEIYTGLIYKGPSLPLQICEELSELLNRDGAKLKDVVGVDIK